MSQLETKSKPSIDYRLQARRPMCSKRVRLRPNHPSPERDLPTAHRHQAVQCLTPLPPRKRSVVSILAHECPRYDFAPRKAAKTIPIIRQTSASLPTLSDRSNEFRACGMFLRKYFIRFSMHKSSRCRVARVLNCRRLDARQNAMAEFCVPTVGIAALLQTLFLTGVEEPSRSPVRREPTFASRAGRDLPRSVSKDSSRWLQKRRMASRTFARRREGRCQFFVFGMTRCYSSRRGALRKKN
jgi:hypothetical protein